MTNAKVVELNTKIMEELCKNCVLLLNINKHPWNGNHKEFGFLEDLIKVGKGKITEQLAWGCALAYEDTLREASYSPSITYFDFNSGMCEMFTPKDKYKLIVKVEEI